MEATFLKVGLPIAQWLLKVICFAWESGIAPAERKSAVIAPLYKGNIPRRRGQPKLHEAQNGLRKERGTTDAISDFQEDMEVVASGKPV
eukprot:363796-Chlamydomonas_euryale.AAC.1